MGVNPDIILDKRILELQMFQDFSSYIFHPDRLPLTESRVVALGLAPTLLKAADNLLHPFSVAAEAGIIPQNDFVVYEAAVKDRKLSVVLSYLIAFYTMLRDAATT